MWLEIILQVETIHVLIFYKVFSDIGQVWGWGYGGEGQLGLGSRIRMVSSPHLIPCLESSSYGKDKSSALARGIVGSEGEDLKVPGSFVKEIACGGRHSAVITGLLFCSVKRKFILNWALGLISQLLFFRFIYGGMRFQ